MRLVAVVGAVEPALFRAFVDHYAKLGVTRFEIAFHFVQSTPTGLREATLRESARLVGSPSSVSSGPWRAETNGLLRDRIRANHAAGEWAVVTDVDEFQYHPVSVQEVTAMAARGGRATVEGLLFDRVAASGRPVAIDPSDGIDKTYALGGFITHYLVGGDCRKVTLARSDVVLGSGNHHSPTHPARVGAPVSPVHHFKWRQGVIEYLERRAMSFEMSDIPDEISMRQECLAILDHFRRNGGRIKVEDERLRLRPTQLGEIPCCWTSESSDVARYWGVDRWIEDG